LTEPDQSLDFNLLQPKPNNWLEENIAYEGAGVAELGDPKGTVIGPFSVRFGEQGGSLVESIFDTALPDDPSYAGDMIAFLCGAKPKQKPGEPTRWDLAGMNNPCERLWFRNETGTFESTGKVEPVGLSFGTEPTRLRFAVRQGRFETKNANPAKYFVIPLLNCIAEVPDKFYGNHPLRIFPTPPLPDNIPEKRRFLASTIANEKNTVIGFYLNGTVCFIERLADYDARLAMLSSGEARQKITAVLVGDVGASPVESLAGFKSWFPFEIFSVLSFTSGAEVGWPWVEIRDGTGALIRRLHGETRIPSFSQVRSVFGPFSRPGTGDLITRFAVLPEDKRSYLRIVMDHTRMGSIGPHMHIHDLLDHLVRALECLCREHKLTQQNLTSGLSIETRNKLGIFIDEMTAKVRLLRDGARRSCNFDEYRLLERIANRATSIAQKENSLGLAVVALLRLFGLPDADVADRLLASQGKSDWATLISSYRNATIHEGFLDFLNKHDLNEVVQLCVHVEDILTRVILKECGYTGTYDSALRSRYGPQKLNWVNAMTDPSALGFK
jgi:hypothetical protein